MTKTESTPAHGYAFPDAIEPELLDHLESQRVWRMGPWRDRRERWDLIPVGDLDLPEEVVRDLFGINIYIAGALAKALNQKVPPPIVADNRIPLEDAIRREVAAVAGEIDKINEGVAELIAAWRARRKGIATARWTQERTNEGEFKLATGKGCDTCGKPIGAGEKYICHTVRHELMGKMVPGFHYFCPKCGRPEPGPKVRNQRFRLVNRSGVGDERKAKADAKRPRKSKP